MIKVITRDNLESIRNDGLKKDAELYLQMYDNFLNELVEFGITIDDQDDSEARTELINELQQLGVTVRNEGKSLLWGNISPSCEDCRTGEGSATYIVSLKCNRDCFFCTNKNQYNYMFHNNEVYDIISQFKKTSKNYRAMLSAGITGGEPLLFVDECIKFIKNAKKTNRKINTRIYTNGDLATEETLKKLAEAGLDEIRFGLKPDEEGQVNENVLKNLENAVKYIPRAMVEMPVTPGQVEPMKILMDKLEEIGIFGINILEFLFPWVHVEDYTAKGYKVRKQPYKILFDYSYAGGVPVAGSELECLEVLKYIAGKKYKMGAHYCSLENKLTAQIWHHNHRFTKAPIEYFSEKDFFVKSAKAYGADAHRAKGILDENGCKHYIYNKSEERIEFSVMDIPFLKGTNMELGIAYMILDREEDKTCVREVAVHMTDTESFSPEDI